MDEQILRQHLHALLSEGHAHVSLGDALTGFPIEQAAAIPDGWAWSAWQLLEHIRIAEQDILDYCTATEYRSLEWPKEYWPDDPAPPSGEAWSQSVEAFQETRRRVLTVLQDDSRSLFEHVPHSDAHTLLREMLLIADHASYHTGQLIALRRVLGSWPL